MKPQTTFGPFSMFAFLLFVMIMSFGQNASAQVTTFAQFLERNGTQDFIFTNNATDGSLSTIVGGSPIFFTYQNIANLPVELQGFQNAHLTVTTTTATPSVLNGGQRNQPLDAITTIAIIRDTPTPFGIGVGSRTNLLTATFSSGSSTPELSGSEGGNSATLSTATPGNNVTFTSDFVGFILTTQRAAALSFSSVVSEYKGGAGGFLDSFTAAGTGTFSSNPPPLYFVPTAAPVSVSGKVTNHFGRGISRVVVTITDPNGDVRYTRTNHFGRFSFADVMAGDSYVINAQAKGYTFNPQVINLDDNISGLNISPNFFW